MHLSDLVATIQKETTINPSWDDPNYLSELLLRLASYYAMLGQFVADAELERDFAETHYKVLREGDKIVHLQAEDSVALATSKSEVTAREDKDNYSKLNHKARLLFISRQSLEKTMDAIRSRLSFIKSDRDNHDNHS